jgi:3-oxoacyl-[acyl-carrier protein] reductase
MESEPVMERPVTVITGARKGIGRFLAEHYVSRGHLVVGCSRGEPDWALENYEHVQLDVADEDAVRQMFRQLRSYGRLDNLVNNAGVAYLNHSLLTPGSTVSKIFDTNVGGSFLFCRESARLMRRRRYGRIVNFTSAAVPLKLDGEAAYAASKAAVVTMTEVLAREFAPLGITVNAFAPGLVATDLIAGLPEEKLQQVLDRHAIPRLATLEEVASTIDFLVAPESGMVTGQAIYLGGP